MNLNKKQLNKRSILILSITLFIIFLLENLYLILIKSSNYTFVNNYVNPVIWIIVSITIMFILPKTHQIGRIKEKNNVIVWTINCAIAYILGYLLLGFVLGFGRTPYDLSFLGILKNLYRVIIPIFGIELLRNHLVNGKLIRNKNITILLTIIFLSLVQIDFYIIFRFNNFQILFIYIAENVIPLISINVFLTYLIMYGGYQSTILYSSIILVFKLCFPVLPDLEWLINALYGLIMPIVFLFFITSNYNQLVGNLKTYRMKKDKWYDWIPSFIFSVVIIWFVVGVFPIYPTVIATGSMEPIIKPGDVAIIERIRDNDDVKRLKIGDIIQFRRDDIIIVHRIIEIINDHGELTFITKGDNNSSADLRHVKVSELKGTLKFVVPKIGWPTLIFRSRYNDTPSDIEF